MGSSGTRPGARGPVERPARQDIEQQIGRLGMVMSLCFILVAGALGYWSVVRSRALVVRDDNPRLIEAERRIRRGDILDRYGRPLVLSEPGPQGTWQRVYLVPDTAPVVGYASIDHGTGGVEDAYNAQIRGQRAQGSVEQLASDLLHVHPAGSSVTLTLDLDVQQAASQALGERTGAVVVLDVRDGDVLAMVSEPTFDPNTLEEDWPRLQFASSKPMLNRATQGLYPPGLVFETVTLAAAMEEGLAEPTTVFTDELGVVLSVDPPISCATDPPKRPFTLGEAYTWPCSVLFARLGLQMGGERLTDYATQLGVGRTIELPIDAATGQLLERGVWSNLLAARTAMGQGEVLVTPLEMALVVATVANDGVRPAPRLVLEVGGEAVPVSGEPRQALSAQTAGHVREILGWSFEVGRQAAALPPANMGGQAGSAESGIPGAPPHAWFVGFAPAAEPRYAIVVIVEHAEGGWEVAAPIAIQAISGLMARGVQQ